MKLDSVTLFCSSSSRILSLLPSSESIIFVVDSRPSPFFVFSELLALLFPHPRERTSFDSFAARVNFTVDRPSSTPIDLSPFDARALSVAPLAADNDQTLSPNARARAPVLRPAR